MLGWGRRVDGSSSVTGAPAGLPSDRNTSRRRFSRARRSPLKAAALCGSAELRDNSERVRKHTFVMDNATYRIILAGLHPEASKQQRDNARAAFERYEKFVLDRKLKPKATAR
jgi:hypothetical protein